MKGRCAMMGPSADGKGWVNINNKCQGAGCDQCMPLPQSHGKHCPKCGVRVLDWSEMPANLNPDNLNPSPALTCSCGAKVKPGDRFCTDCGEAILTVGEVG